MIVGVSTRLPMDELTSPFTNCGHPVGNVIASALAAELSAVRPGAGRHDRAKTAFSPTSGPRISHAAYAHARPPGGRAGGARSTAACVRRERLATAHRNSLRLLKLVKTLLDFSRIEAGRAQVSCQPTDVAMFTAELAGHVSLCHRDAGLTLTVDCRAARASVRDRICGEKSCST